MEKLHYCSVKHEQLRGSNWTSVLKFDIPSGKTYMLRVPQYCPNIKSCWVLIVQTYYDVPHN